MADLGSDWTDTSDMVAVPVAQTNQSQDREHDLTELDNSLHHDNNVVETAVLKRDKVTKHVA